MYCIAVLYKTVLSYMLYRQQKRSHSRAVMRSPSARQMHVIP